MDYIEDNFTRVYDVEQSKRHFLNCNWKTIFTLNYDDTIENVIDIDVIIPYDKFSFRSRKRNMIKLHGDAKRFSCTGDSRYCVLGNQQYVALVKAENNRDLIKVLENVFYSKSILFVGCSLDDELDLLYSAGMQLEEKVKKNDLHRIIYLFYSDDEKDIYTTSKKLEDLCEGDLIQEYINIEFEYLGERNTENIEYLFYNDKVKINNNIIKYSTFL